MKKLMILGGSPFQLSLIKASKKEGYFTIVVDGSLDCVGKEHADKFINCNFIDKEKALEVARKENIDGVISNSERAMEIVAYIASELNLPGNTPQAIANITSKDCFRKFQKEIGIYAPNYFLLEDRNNIKDIVSKLSFPIVIKPSESSGTRGVTVIDKFDEKLINNVFDDCKEFSRNNKVCIEEYVKMPTYNVIEGELFVLGNDIIWDGLFNDKRSKDEPTLPMSDMIPFVSDEKSFDTIKKDVSLVFNKAGIVHGQYNIEMYFNENNELFIIEINPRQGGFKNVSIVNDCCDVDLNKMLVTTCVGDNDYFYEELNKKKEYRYIIEHIVFSKVDGIFKGIEINDSIKDSVQNIEYLKDVGSNINVSKNAEDALATISLKFNDYTKQKEVFDNIEEMIKPIVE